MSSAVFGGPFKVQERGFHRSVALEAIFFSRAPERVGFAPISVYHAASLRKIGGKFKHPFEIVEKDAYHAEVR